MSDGIFWLWFPAFFVALWLCIFYGVSRWGGWRALSSVYPSRGIPSGARFRMRSVQLRAGCSYNSCVTFISGSDGLHISLPLVFAFQHPPLLLPWSELRATEDHVWFVRIVILTTARCPEIPIKLSRHLATRLLEGPGAHLLAELEA